MSAPNEREQEEPAFLDDEGPSAEIPPFVTTTNARELYGLRNGETVAEAIVRVHDELKADPTRAITADQVRERLASEHARRQGAKKIATIDEMNEAAAAGWAGEIKVDKLPNFDADKEGGVRQSAAISAGVPAAVKAEAKAILAAHGVSMAWLLREFLTRVAAHDAETLAWLDAARR